LKVYCKALYCYGLLQVIDGGELDINFVVEAPTGRLVVPDIKKTGNVHKLAS